MITGYRLRRCHVHHLRSGSFFHRRGQTFIDIALRVAGRLRGGAGKISVVSSSLFGMISGSAVANVGVDGEFTIPMMKKLGYRKELASAIEATASTGGQIMPPVMGRVPSSWLRYWEFLILKFVLPRDPRVLYYVASGLPFNLKQRELA